MKKRQIEWLEHISSLDEFTSDSSWSVYNARKEDRKIVLCVNSVLPLLRQSVETYSIQKHCIDVAKNAIDALNLDQLTVDTGDPAHLCSFKTIAANISRLSWTWKISTHVWWTHHRKTSSRNPWTAYC